MKKTSTASPSAHRQEKRFSTSFLALVAIIVVILLGTAIYFYQQYAQAKRLMQDQATVAKKEAQTLLQQVGRLILLPSAEEPTIATVSDKSKLAGQVFFARAEDGDRVLIFAKAKRAILYRPSLNKIIEFGPINITSPSAATKPTTGNQNVTPQKASLRIAIYNGTQISGFAASTETKIREVIPYMETSIRTNAAENYTKTQVIDLAGNQAEATKQIAALLGGDIASLPSAEKRPDADILVILGQ